MIDKKIITYIRPIKYKIFIEKLIKYTSFYLLIASLISLLIMIYSKFFELVSYKDLILNVVVLSLVFSLMHSLIRMPKRNEIIKKTDSLGLSERLLTAMELKNDDSDIAKIQREDSLRMMKKFNPYKVYKIKYNKKIIFAVLLSFSLLLGLSFMETKISFKNDEEAKTIKDIKKDAKELDKKLKESLNSYDFEKKELEKVLNDLNLKLKKAKNKEEALKALSIAKNNLKDLEKKAEKDGKMSNSDKKALESALKNIDEAGKNMAGKSISDFAFKNNNSFENNSNNQTNSQNTNSSSSQNANSENSSESSSNSTSQSNQSSESNNSSAQGGNQSEEGNQSAQGQGQGEGQGEGKGKGQGQGQGEGKGEGSGGAGNLSSNEERGYSETNSSSSKNSKQFSESKLEVYEALYLPNRLGGHSNPDFVSGEKSGKGEKTYKDAQNIPSDSGEIVNYKEVYAEYSENAVYKSNNMEIPSGMKTVVKEYFESLND